MSDPRTNDPRLDVPRDARFNLPPEDPMAREPMARRADGGVTTWAWIGGIAAVLLIAILALGNWHTGTDTGTPQTANNGPSVVAPTDRAPSTTGSGMTAPANPAPAQPSAPPAQ